MFHPANAMSMSVLVFPDVPWASMESGASVAWSQAVRVALGDGDTERLAELFSQAREVWGSERASRLWLETVSAYDANAVTG